MAHDKKNKRLFWAVIGVIINLLILSLFKYGSLITHLFIDTFSYNRPEEGIIALLLHLPLPIGISFYTFEGISLVIDVMRQRDKDLEQNNFVSSNLLEHFLNTSFFIAFFPHLIAGPILKARQFYPQISIKYFKNINWYVVFNSLVVGYFLKMVVADNLKDYTFWIAYPYYQGLGTITNLCLLFGYSMQIFADFAGYSLIAIGLGASLGYSLPDNFNFPYISRSIAEFWRRWHISLSTWLRDYLYISLGGNRKGKVRTYINLMIVMTLGGLWHGAAWSYAVWGIFHGIGLAIERFLGLDNREKNLTENSKFTWKNILLDYLQILAVFSFVSLGWLLFKLPRFEEALDFLVSLFQDVELTPQLSKIIPVMIFSLPVIIYHIPHLPHLQKSEVDNNYLPKNAWWILCKEVAIGIMLAAILLNSGNSDEFIYFQF
ncbi:MAG TPA: MBOAT family O-acyltransferase [Leptolyngbyaceae cyanobacterium]